MDWKRRRLIAILSTILTILVILVLIVGGIRYRQLRQASAQLGPAAVSGDAAQEEYVSLQYHNGTTTLAFSRDLQTGRWCWSDDPDFPLDDTTVTAIVDLLSDLRPQQTLTAPEEDESYGLDEPTGTLSAVSADGTVLDLTFGKTTTDGNSYYIRKNNDADTVYIIADTLYQYMCVPIYDMCALPSLPQLTEDRLDAVRVSSTESSIRFTVKDGVWKTDGKDVTGRANVTALAGELEALTLVKCVDYKPSAKAVELCGFSEPQASVTVDYRTESGTEQSLTFSIGGAALDGTGRYVRLSGDSAIYQVPADGVDTLLTVAENGLAA